MKIRVGTFNLFQFVEPPYSWYEKKDKFTQEQWIEKRAWIKNQITSMNCDVIGFQEVFSQNALKDLCKELGFEYFITVDTPKVHEKNELIYVSTTVALASKYPISNIKSVKKHTPSLKKHHFKSDFKFARTPIKADITIPNKQDITIYVCHLKSNRENEFEYIFNENHTLEEKNQQVQKALKENFSKSLKQRLCEASSLFFDMKKQKDKPYILVCDLNDRLHALTIDALSNNKYHDETRKETFILKDAYYEHERKIYNPHPEQKEIQREATSYFIGKGNVLDFIFISNHFSKKNKNAIAKVSNYELFNKHIEENHAGSILKSDHAQVVCELNFKKD
ncbi:endonuclease [Arcobacter sp. YIC-80]|uniref:endonuclease/exonuclease/phosphatase family protein n=1 Tax=Arcobacter sp. YIC-80 TaxID=3376683 RepID=UPI00384AC4D6